MARAGEQLYEWDKQPRMPLPAPQRGSCEGLEKFPPRPNPPYPPIESATFTEAQRTLGFDQWTKRMMNDAEEVELLYRYVDGDTELLCKMLVDNPARLRGFKI